MYTSPTHRTPPRGTRARRNGVALAAGCLGAALLLVPGQATGSESTGAAEPGPYYLTNPEDQVGSAAEITLDGDAAEWTPELVVAQGVANDDPRIFRGSHEGPVYDLYALSAAWDATHLYLMWQFTNVTDVVDPAQSYPISDNGKPYAVDIPQAIALDVDPEAAGDGLVDGTEDGVWGVRSTFAPDQGVDTLLMFSSKPGLGEPAIFTLNQNGSFDYEEENVRPFEEAGVEYAYADGLTTDEVIGIDGTGNADYVPEDLADASLYEDLLAAGHDSEQDTTYEIGIPLEALGITQADLAENGVGAMLTTTFGESAIGSLPHDPVVLDEATEPYSADPSTSAEKEDADAFTVPFARIGRL